MNTIKCIRGCGTRKPGSIYLCCGQSITGQEIEKFIIDPAIVWPYEWIRGFKIVDSKRGHNNVLIFVGKQFYKSSWDFVEECRRFGASRHVRSDFPFEQLTPGKSRMVFIHKNVIPQFDYATQDLYDSHNCNKGNCDGIHNDGNPCTYSLRDLSHLLHSDAKSNGWNFTIKMPDFEYNGVEVSYEEPIKWQTGAFLSLVITHIECPVFNADDITLKVANTKNKVNQAGYDFQMLDY